MIVHPCNNLCSSIGPFRVSRAGFGPLFALELKQGDILTALYAPLRLLHYENDEGKTCREHDRPSSILVSSGTGRINPFAAERDRKVEALVTTVMS